VVNGCPTLLCANVCARCVAGVCRRHRQRAGAGQAGCAKEVVVGERELVVVGKILSEKREGERNSQSIVVNVKPSGMRLGDRERRRQRS